MVHPDGGTGSLRLTLALTPQNLYAGTWQSQFANAAYTRAGRALSTSAGSLTATIGISDNDFATSPDRTQPGCLFDHYVILTVGIESNELKGDALFGICANGATLGSVTLRRQ